MAEPKQNTTQPAFAAVALKHPLGYTCLLALIWLAPGLLTHDPWRGEDATSVGIVYQALQSGDWWFPALAGEPLPDRMPLFYATAAAFARMFGGMLPLHDAARLACAFYLILSLLTLGATGRLLLGRGKGWLPVVALMGSLGLIMPMHVLLPEAAEMAAYAIGLLGLALLSRRAAAGGIALGTAVGLAFLSKGLAGPLALAVAAAMLPIFAPAWRTRTCWAGLAIAAVAALPWLIAWPAALHHHAPDWFRTWWALHGPGGDAGLGFAGLSTRLGTYAATLAWYTFPTLLLAAWAVWQGRGQLRSDPALAAPAALAGATLLALLVANAGHDVSILPLLLPIAMLAVPGVLTLRRGAASAFFSFSVLFGGFMLLMGWFEWSALDLGLPAARHRHWLRQQPAYEPGFRWLPFLAAALLSAAWVWGVRRLRRTPDRPLVAWTIGVCMVWGLAAATFLPYLDAGKSYRSVAQEVKAALPSRFRCVESLGLGEPQRASLHYFAGLVTQRVEAGAPGRKCDFLLIQGRRTGMPAAGPGWNRVWEGARPGDGRELLRLYRRNN